MEGTVEIEIKELISLRKKALYLEILEKMGERCYRADYRTLAELTNYHYEDQVKSLLEQEF